MTLTLFLVDTCCQRSGVSYKRLWKRSFENFSKYFLPWFGLVWFGLVYSEVHVKSHGSFFYKKLYQRKACSAFLSPESLHDRDPQSWLDTSYPQSWLDTSLRPGATLSWKMILTQ